MKRYSLLLFTAFISLCGVEKLMAQALPVGTPVIEDYYRRMQLLGKVDSNVSFTIRPINPAKSFNVSNIYRPDSADSNSEGQTHGQFTFAGKRGLLQILPLNWQSQINTHHPYGWNDGAMIPARGYQTLLSGGFYLKYGPLSIQLRPEFVYAQNSNFDGFDKSRSDDDLRKYYSYYSAIDRPERFGTGSYHKLFWGQSSIRLAFGPVSAGLSNENVWWGPGIRNSLLLSNNAPGFEHITLNTVRPIKTYIGSFEGQILGGYLKSSGYNLFNTTNTSNGLNLTTNKFNGNRYFTGLNINYHPKWVTGLTLGLTRTFNAYKRDINTFKDYFPFFTPYEKATVGEAGDAFSRDQYTSLYARWLFTQAHAEIYFEYGLNDNSYNYKDFIGSPDHSRAYLVGMRKMIKLNAYHDQYILVSGEITQLSQSVDRLVRDASTWYIHSGVLQGHTNQGQVLGAGTGPGGNLQSFDVSWVQGIKKIGVTFERYEHDVDFTRSAFPDINGNSRKWVDFAFGVQGEWAYKNLLFDATLQGIRSLNYEWVLKDYNPANYYIPHNDVLNCHLKLGVTYRF
jgi:hypothetical protein